MKALVLAGMVWAPTAVATAEFRSTCTEAAVTVSRNEQVPLLATTRNPVLSMTQIDNTVVIGRSAAVRLLKQRMRWLQGQMDPVSGAPLGRSAETILQAVSGIAMPMVRFRRRGCIRRLKACRP